MESKSVTSLFTINYPLSTNILPLQGDNSWDSHPPRCGGLAYVALSGRNIATQIDAGNKNSTDILLKILFDILQKSLLASQVHVDIEEMVFSLIFGVMGIVILSFGIILIPHWKLFIRKTAYCTIISLLFMIVIFCGTYVEHFPQSPNEWEYMLNEFLRAFILSIGISCFVAVVWTFL
jgi:hypothetical protein